MFKNSVLCNILFKIIPEPDYNDHGNDAIDENDWDADDDALLVQIKVNKAKGLFLFFHVFFYIYTC